MDILHLIGRLMAGGFFLMSAFSHFTKAAMLAGYAGSRGLPSPRMGVYVSGAMLLLGGLSLLLGLYPRWGIAMLVAFLLAAMLFIHKFWAVPADQKMTEQVNFMKNLGLIGALLALLALAEPWPFSLGN